MKLTTRADGFSFHLQSSSSSMPWLFSGNFLLSVCVFVLYIFWSWNNNNHQIVCKKRRKEREKRENEKQIYRKSTPIFPSNPSCCSESFSAAVEKTSTALPQRIKLVSFYVIWYNDQPKQIEGFSIFLQ